MRCVLPDYTNCGLNVAASVLRHFGAPTNQPGHPDVDALLGQRTYKNIVLMLFDGLGMASLEEHLPPDSFLRTHLLRRMTAVFPPTTVAATTSIESGEAPCEHAWLGWTLYFEELDRRVNVFTNTDAQTGERLPGEVRAANRFLPYRGIVEKLSATGRVQARIISKHGDTPAETLDELLQKASQCCAAPGRQYIYTYYNEPDHTMHETGVMGVGDIVKGIDARVRDFCAAMGGETLVMITADHGLIDCEQVPLDRFPDLAAACERPFHIESRAAGFFVRPECRRAFPGLVAQALGTEDFWVLSREEVLRMGLFGNGREHPRFRGLLGDYLVIATGKRSLAPTLDPHPLVAQHAGLTPREMYVPLIVGAR